jgi:hypothetical protein
MRTRATTHRKRRRTPWSAWGTAVLLLAAAPLLVTDSVPPPAAQPAPATVAPAPAEVDAPSSVPTSPSPPAQSGLAQAAVDAAESRAAGSTQLAVAVLDRSTGEMAVGGRGDEPFYTASLSKLIVIVDMLDRRRLEGLTLTDDELALIHRTLGPSDDSAMSVLWERFDGAGAPARVSRRLGLEGTSAPRRFGQWGEVEVTAVDYVKIWRHILDEMPAEDRDLLITAMQAAPSTANDGFDQAFGLLSPAVRGDGSGAVAKQGWMCCFSGQYYLHSAGAVGADKRFLVALLTREPRGKGWTAARTEVTGIATEAVSVLE